MSLFNTAKKGLGWNTIGAVLRSVIGLVQLGLLSRFLSAEELGTYSQFFLVSTFTMQLTVFGLTPASISRGELEPEQERQLGLGYLLNGIIMASIVVLAAPLLGLLFVNPLLSQVLIWYGPAVLLLAVGNFAAMQCQKSLNFRALIIAETLGALAGVIVLTLSLLFDAGVYAFIAGITANFLIRTLLLQWRVRQIYLAIWQLKWAELKTFYHYGWQFTGGNLLSLAVTSMDILLISRLLGVEQTGQYGIIKDLVFRVTTMLNPILTRVALPFYAKLQGHQGLGDIYCSVKELLCYLTVPVYAFFVVFPDISISILLGEKWVDLGLLLQLLAAWMIVRSVISQSGSLLSAVGKVRQMFVWNILVAIIVPVVIYSGAQFGLVGVALALVCAQSALYLPHWYFLLRPAANIALWPYLRAIGLPLLISFTSLFLVSLVSPYIELPLPWQLASLLILAALAYSVLSLHRVRHLYLGLKDMSL
jgi:lipopolysaccharide exporter